MAKANQLDIKRLRTESGDESLSSEKSDSDGVITPTHVYRMRSAVTDVLSTDEDSARSASESSASESADRKKRKKRSAQTRYSKTQAGKKTLQAGTPKRIVEWLVEKEVRPLKINDNGAVNDVEPQKLGCTLTALSFFAAYQQHIRPVTLFEIIKEYFKKPPTQGKLKKHEKRRRAMYLLETWCAQYFVRDFYTPRDGKKIRAPDGMSRQLLLFLDSIKNKFQTEVNRIKLSILRGVAAQPHTSNVKRRQKAAKNINCGRVDVLSLDTRELAQQMTLVESELFLSIKSTEFFNQCWKKTDSKKKSSPHIVLMVERFNTVSYWVSSAIVMCKELRKRILILSKFINLAEILLAQRNYNCLMAALGGLNNAAVQRLKLTWNGIKPAEKQTFDGLLSLMESKSNFKKYRDALASDELGKFPVVPYLGIYLRDLTFIDDGNADFLDNLLNLEKLAMMGDIIREVEHWQSNGGYEFKRNAELEAYLMKLVVLPEDTLYKLSEGLEPPGSAH